MQKQNANILFGKYFTLTRKKSQNIFTDVLYNKTIKKHKKDEIFGKHHDVPILSKTLSINLIEKHKKHIIRYMKSLPIKLKVQKLYTFGLCTLL